MAWLALKKQLRGECDAGRANKAAGRAERPAARGWKAVEPKCTTERDRENDDRDRRIRAGQWLDGNGRFNLQVVGESQYQRALEQICGGRTHQGEDRILDAVLLLDDDNPYDQNAVRVEISGLTAGYLSRDTAQRFRSRIRKEDLRADKFACRANIRGGWDRSEEDCGHFGVWLDVCLYAR